MRFKTIFMVVFLLIATDTIVTSMSDVWVELRAPRFVVHRHSAVLRCEHNTDPEHIYKVVFFKDGHRIMQYVHGRDPPFELYNFTGADIKLAKLSSTSLTLDDMDFSASGSYACEIAMETPLLYSKLSKFHEISIIVRQKYRPKIKIKHRKFTSSEVLEATCQSAPAHPAPHLAWFINNVKVDESYTTPNGAVSVHKHHHGMPLSVTNTSLHYPISLLTLTPNQTVDISCLSTIPSYASVVDGFADIQNYTLSVKVILPEPAPTQLPVKIVASASSAAGGSTLEPCLLHPHSLFVVLFYYLMCF